MDGWMKLGGSDGWVGLGLRTLVIIDADGTLVAQAMAPPAIDHRGGIPAVREQQPEAKDGLGQDVEDGVGDDLAVDGPDARSFGQAPHDGVQGPEDQGVADQGGEELRGARILGAHGPTAGNGQLVDDDEVRQTRDGVPAPFLAGAVAEGGEETGQNHGDVGGEGDEGVGAAETGQEGQVEQDERGGDGAVDVASPEDLSEDVLDRGGGVLVGFLDHDVRETVSITRGHGEVGERGKEGDEGG